jgi:hypothetical protein
VLCSSSLGSEMKTVVSPSSPVLANSLPQTAPSSGALLLLLHVSGVGGVGGATSGGRVMGMA